jgi:hypothetical protein
MTECNVVNYFEQVLSSILNLVPKKQGSLRASVVSVCVDKMMQPAARSIQNKDTVATACKAGFCMLRVRHIAVSTRVRVWIPACSAVSTRAASNVDMEHCLDLLKQHDLERTYLQLAFVPSELRFQLKSL